MKNHFISYDKADFIGDDTQDKVFELMAICIADGTRIIIEREEKKGRRYLMVDFSPTDKSNTNFIMDNYVCAITSVEGDDEGDISEDFANYLDACRWLADFISKGDFTEIHIETY